MHEPPAPLELVASVDRLEVVVPDDGRRQAWATTVTMGSLFIGAAWVATLGLLLVLFVSAGVTAWFVILFVATNVLFGGASIVAFTAFLQILAQGGRWVTSRTGWLDVGRDRVSWEAVVGIDNDQGRVALHLADGSVLEVARDLPPDATFWLANMLRDQWDTHRARRRNDTALAELTGLRHRPVSDGPRPTTAWSGDRGSTTARSSLPA